MLLYVSPKMEWNLRFVCCAEPASLYKFREKNLKQALGSTFHLLQYVPRTVPDECCISAIIDHLASFSPGAFSTKQDICGTFQNHVAGRSHSPLLTFPLTPIDLRFFPNVALGQRFIKTSRTQPSMCLS